MTMRKIKKKKTHSIIMFLDIYDFMVPFFFFSSLCLFHRERKGGIYLLLLLFLLLLESSSSLLDRSKAHVLEALHLCNLRLG